MDKNENLHDDMISILEHIHQKYIAHTSGENAEVTERKVFGGDVLTNERAYTAQLAMLNCETNYHQLGGVIHRPEGLHRMMNFLLVFQHAGVQFQFLICSFCKFRIRSTLFCTLSTEYSCVMDIFCRFMLCL